MADDTQTTAPWVEPPAEGELERARRYSKWLQSNITRLLARIGDPGQCRSCNAEIVWVRHKSGTPAPYDPTGLNHFGSCPSAKQHRATK